MMMFVAVVATSLTSCTDGDGVLKDGPGITFVPNETSKEISFADESTQTVEFKAIIEAESEVSTFIITEYVYKNGSVASNVVFDEDETDFKGETEKNYNFSRVFTTTDFEEGVDKIEYQFVVTDKEDKEVTKTFTVTAKTTQDLVGVTAYTAKIVGSFGSSAYGSAFDAHTGDVLMSADAKANSEKVDMVYDYDQDNSKAIIYAPQSLDGSDYVSAWTTKNNTKFAVSAISFDDTNTSEQLDAVVANDLNIEIVIDAVYAFITVDGKKGLFKVTAIEVGNKGSITIDVKIQE